MPVSDEFISFVMDQLSGLGRLRSRRMFGGAGIYLGDVMFGLVADDVVYLRTDDQNRADFEDRDMDPFRPWPDKPSVMPYHEVPLSVLEDEEELRAWALKARAAAKRSKSASKKKR